MNTCRQCKTQFKTKAIIDGKPRNLGNRKFCLVCSPFGKHNTKPDDPTRKPVRGVGVSYKDWQPQARETLRKCTHIRGIIVKQRLIKTVGGCCIQCGYSKELSVLTFHHRDRTTKQFALSADILRRKSWNMVLDEASKCDLLCLNCHMETEHRFAESNGHGPQHIRGKERKQEALQLLGNRCSTCGYDKCFRCLSFHHIDPTQKEFPLDIRAFNGYSWERLNSEIAKCQLLCLNCHAELERKLHPSKYNPPGRI